MKLLIMQLSPTKEDEHIRKVLFLSKTTIRLFPVKVMQYINILFNVDVTVNFSNQ
jgi:hypothetical protein